LPDPETAARRFGELGISPGMKVIAYDDAGGSLAAVRLWWMLRWLGHSETAVLDGGWQAWLAEDYPVRGGGETRPPQIFSANPRPGLFVTTQEVERLRQDPSYRLFDVRTAERYRGEVEPIDPVAGHIPGARNAPYLQNLDAEGAFRSPEQLRLEYQALLGDAPIEKVVFYCGSGVTSIHSILALLHAGLGEARLYAGSWSEWIADPNRPVATGPTP
jgi:thiosulfate/3-mercaptopyruvate sulfurtransferase